MQDTGAGSPPAWRPWRRAAGVQPQRQGGVPQVVRAAGKRGGGQFWSERGRAGGVPGAAVDGLAERANAAPRGFTAAVAGEPRRLVLLEVYGRADARYIRSTWDGDAGATAGPAHDRVSRKPGPLTVSRTDTAYGRARRNAGSSSAMGRVRFARFYLLSIWSWPWDGVPLCQGRTWPNRTSSP